jgi:hypothetical protein
MYTISIPHLLYCAIEAMKVSAHDIKSKKVLGEHFSPADTRCIMCKKKTRHFYAGPF